MSATMIHGGPRYLVAGLLLLVTVAVYGQVAGYPFVSYDDPLYVTQNENVRQGLSMDGVVWAFTTRHFGIWHPVTWLSHMVDCELFGVRAGLHHLVNLVLQMANVLLLFSVLRAMTRSFWPSAFVAALFAVHPLHVESVAWVSERKDLLTMLFGLLSLRAYVDYAKDGRLGRYLMVALLFALALMAKPMLVTLPFGLLLLDYWPLGRLRFTRDQEPHPRGGENHPEPETPRFRPRPFTFLLVEKVPLLALSAGASGMALFAEHTRGTLPTTNTISFDLRLANAAVSYVRYIGKMIWPTDLSVLYPHPNFPGGTPWTGWQIAGAVALLVAVTSLVVWRAAKQKYLIVGWLWYLGMLVPAIGLVQVGKQAMADHFAYVPLIGLYIMIAWGGADLVSRWPGRRVVRVAAHLLADAMLAVLAVCAWDQVGHWRDSVALFEHALRVTSANATALNNLGSAYFQSNRFQEAIDNYSQAVALEPKNAMLYDNRGTAYRTLKNYRQAVEDYTQAIELEPEHAPYLNNRGAAYGLLGQYGQAIADCTRAIELKPDFADAYYNRMLCYHRTRLYARAWNDAQMVQKLGRQLPPQFVKELAVASGQSASQ